MDKLPLYGLLALGSAKAAEPSIPYTIPERQEVIQICSSPTLPLCDSAEVKKVCAVKKSEYKAELAAMSDEELRSFDDTREALLARWNCPIALLEPTSCTTTLGEMFPYDENGDGKVTFKENYGTTIKEQIGLLTSGGTRRKSSFGFDMYEAGADVAIRRTVESQFCPLDTNRDGVISKDDDVDENGKIDEKDRQSFRKP